MYVENTGPGAARQPDKERPHRRSPSPSIATTKGRGGAGGTDTEINGTHQGPSRSPTKDGGGCQRCKGKKNSLSTNGVGAMGHPQANKGPDQNRMSDTDTSSKRIIDLNVKCKCKT